jgi:hypothetical protein
LNTARLNPSSLNCLNEYERLGWRLIIMLFKVTFNGKGGQRDQSQLNQ